MTELPDSGHSENQRAAGADVRPDNASHSPSYREEAGCASAAHHSENPPSQPLGGGACADAAPSGSPQASEVGTVTVTTNEAGDVVAVTSTDDEGRIVKTFWTRKQPPERGHSGWVPVGERQPPPWNEVAVAINGERKAGFVTSLGAWYEIFEPDDSRPAKVTHWFDVPPPPPTECPTRGHSEDRTVKQQSPKDSSK